MSSSAYGTLAALAAPLMMTLGFIVWDKHWKGSAFALNLFKCNLASIGFLILSFATRPRGIIFPSHNSRPVYFLILSSTFGILLGDLFWLEGMRLLGARRVIVVDSVKPFLAALMGWAILKENLLPPAFLGMAITVIGVLVVSLEKEAGKTKEDDANVSDCAVSSPHEELETVKKQELTSFPASKEHDVEENQTNLSDSANGGEATSHNIVDILTPPPATRIDECSKRVLTPQSMRKGYTMACLNVILDTYGSILTRQYGVGLTTWEINLVRFGFAGACLLIVAIAFHLRDLIARSQQRYNWFSTNRPANSDSAPPHPPPRVSDDDKQDNIANQFSSPPSPIIMPWYCLPNNMTRRSWIQVVIGVMLVTFLAPTLSNYALFRIAVAIAITLCSICPLYVLPLAYVLQNDKPTTRAIWGSVLAVAGIAILAFWKDTWEIN